MLQGLSSVIVALCATISCQDLDMQEERGEKGPLTSASDYADVVLVETSGGEATYDFSVGIKSPDTGCDRYADWWEVVDEEGTLIYRRTLAHSHVNEQPFVRSGGPVTVAANETVWVRAHMYPGGYGGMAFKGSVAEGFRRANMIDGFGADLEDDRPQPSACAG